MPIELNIYPRHLLVHLQFFFFCFCFLACVKLSPLVSWKIRDRDSIPHFFEERRRMTREIAFKSNNLVFYDITSNRVMKKRERFDCYDSDSRFPCRYFEGSNFPCNLQGNFKTDSVGGYSDSGELWFYLRHRFSADFSIPFCHHWKL